MASSEPVLRVVTADELSGASPEVITLSIFGTTFYGPLVHLVFF